MIVDVPGVAGVDVVKQGFQIRRDTATRPIGFGVYNRLRTPRPRC